MFDGRTKIIPSSSLSAMTICPIIGKQKGFPSNSGESFFSTWHSFGSLVALRGIPVAVGAAAAAEVNSAFSVLLLGRVELAGVVIVASGTVSPSVVVGSSVASGPSDAVAVSGSVPGAMMMEGAATSVGSEMADSRAVAVFSAVWVGVFSRRPHNQHMMTFAHTRLG